MFFPAAPPRKPANIKRSRLGAFASYSVRPFDSIVYETIETFLMPLTANFHLKISHFVAKTWRLRFRLYVPTPMHHPTPLFCL